MTRKQFEAFLAKHLIPNDRHLQYSPGLSAPNVGEYKNPAIEFAWMAVQEANTLAQEEAASLFLDTLT